MPGKPRLWSVSRNTGSCSTSTLLWLTMWGCGVPRTPTNCRVRWLQSAPGVFPSWFWCGIVLLQLLTADSVCLSSSWGINNGCSPLIACRNETFILLEQCLWSHYTERRFSSLWWLGRKVFASEDDWTVGKNTLFKILLTMQSLYQLVFTTCFASGWNSCVLSQQRSETLISSGPRHTHWNFKKDEFDSLRIFE